MKQKQYRFYLISAALLALCFVLTLIWSFLILSVMSLITGLIGRTAAPKTEAAAESTPEPHVPLTKRKVGYAPLLFFGTAIFLFLTPPVALKSPFKQQYPFQSRFLSVYRYGEPDWFPDFRKDVRSDYCFEFLPSIMQGTGFYTVHFVTTPDRAAEYTEQFSDAGAEAVSLPECLADFDSAVHVNEDFFPEPDAATVYVIDSNRNRNHPHSKTVTVDPGSGRVEITQYG